MSDTPETDALLAEYPDPHMTPDGNTVSVVASLIHHARRLERELTAANHRIAELERTLSQWRDQPLSYYRPLKTILPALAVATLKDRDNRIAELELAASELLSAIQSVEPDVEISPREAVAIMAMKDVLNRPAAKREGGG